MAKKIELDTNQAASQIKELIALIEKLKQESSNISVNMSGAGGSSVSGIPGMAGSVGVVSGSASISVPLTVGGGGGGGNPFFSEASGPKNNWVNGYWRSDARTPAGFESVLGGAQAGSFNFNSSWQSGAYQNSGGGGGMGGFPPTAGSAGGAGGVGIGGAGGAGGGGFGSGYGYGGYGYAASAIANIAGQVGTNVLDYQTQRILQGGDDPLARGRGVGQAIGVGLGVAAGFATANPFVGLAVAGFASNILGSLGEYINAPEAAKQSANTANAPLFGSFYGSAASTNLDRYTGVSQVENQYSKNAFEPAAARDQTSLFERTARRANAKGIGSTNPELFTDVNDVGRTFGAISSGLYAGGINPFGAGEKVDGFTLRTFNKASFDKDIDLVERANRLKDPASRIGETIGLAEQVQNKARRGGYISTSTVEGEQEDLATTYTRRLSLLFGKDASVVAPKIGSIFGSEPETGGNIADILGRFGAQNTTTYLRIQDKNLNTPIDPLVLAQTSAGIRGAGRTAAIGSLAATSSGANAERAFASQEGIIAGLPGGRDSLAFAQADSNRRSARAQRFGQDDITSYGLEATALQGQRERINLLPFGSGNLLATELSTIRNNTKQLGVIGDRLKLGDLSEQERLSLTQQREGLLTQNAQGVAQLSEGLENRLPSLSSGRSSSFSRFDSSQLAALAYARQGSPNRSSGAINGKQAQDQQDFLSGFGVAGANSAHSRTGDINSSSAVEVLTRILSALEKNQSANKTGNMTKASEVAGQVASQINNQNSGRSYEGRGY